ARHRRGRFSLDRAQPGQGVRILRAVRDEPAAGDQVGDVARGRAAEPAGPRRGRARNVRGPGRRVRGPAQGHHGATTCALRGEGGQNLIGPELGPELGVIRTEELLAARREDGAHQFFTRAYDFGFSKTAEETLRFWPRDSLLADVLEVIRRFRPQIILSIFS